MKRFAGAWLLAFATFALQACEESKFQNEAAPSTSAPIKEEAPTLPPHALESGDSAGKLPEPESGVLVEDEEPAVPMSTPEPPAPPPPPPGAVVKGSFTVYAEPRNPAPGQDYQIFVKVNLPPGAAEDYERRDLAIQVRGTDGFTATFSQFGNGVQKNFSVNGNVATAIMQIPGAERNVKDVITCSSKLLNETQQIDLVFGSKP